jgi:hypothetical protein
VGCTFASTIPEAEVQRPPCLKAEHAPLPGCRQDLAAQQELNREMDAALEHALQRAKEVGAAQQACMKRPRFSAPSS